MIGCRELADNEVLRLGVWVGVWGARWSRRSGGLEGGRGGGEPAVGGGPRRARLRAGADGLSSSEDGGIEGRRSGSEKSERKKKVGWGGGPPPTWTRVRAAPGCHAVTGGVQELPPGRRCSHATAHGWETTWWKMVPGPRHHRLHQRPEPTRPTTASRRAATGVHADQLQYD
jgi:hypothetical protein